MWDSESGFAGICSMFCQKVLDNKIQIMMILEEGGQDSDWFEIGAWFAITEFTIT